MSGSFPVVPLGRTPPPNAVWVGRLGKLAFELSHEGRKVVEQRKETKIMSHFDDNKYRFILKPRSPFKTEAYSRREAIDKINKWQEQGIRVGGVKFNQRKISAEHRKTLIECARLWLCLDQKETEVKNRKTNRK